MKNICFLALLFFVTTPSCSHKKEATSLLKLEQLWGGSIIFFEGDSLLISEFEVGDLVTIRKSKSPPIGLTIEKGSVPEGIYEEYIGPGDTHYSLYQCRIIEIER